MDRLWTPWRYNYVTGSDQPDADPRKGVPKALEAWPGEDQKCVFCNLIQSVEWASGQAAGAEAAERAGYIVARLKTCFVCLNAFPYASGHVLIVPYRHTDSLLQLSRHELDEQIAVIQSVEAVFHKVYKPDGINVGLNLGKAAGAGVANHLHFHQLPRWVGDTNFMTVTAETRILPETLDVTWERLRIGWREVSEEATDN
jgi:ATP adenylyltransferase